MAIINLASSILFTFSFSFWKFIPSNFNWSDSFLLIINFILSFLISASLSNFSFGLEIGEFLQKSYLLADPQYIEQRLLHLSQPLGEDLDYFIHQFLALCNFDLLTFRSSKTGCSAVSSWVAFVAAACASAPEWSLAGDHDMCQRGDYTGIRKPLVWSRDLNSIAPTSCRRGHWLSSSTASSTACLLVRSLVPYREAPRARIYCWSGPVGLFLFSE